MEPQGLTLAKQQFFDTGGRDVDEITRASIDAATEYVEMLTSERKDDLSDLIEAGVDIWDAMAALGIVVLERDAPIAEERGPKRDRIGPWSTAFTESLMVASVQPDRRGSRSRTKGAKKRAGMMTNAEPPLLTSYGWKLKSA